jgi:peptide/nickel transport system substrate-binding protein
LGAKPLLGDLPPPKVVPGEALTVMFPAAEPKRLAEALTSPLCAIVPRSFNPEAPEGTGAFRARLAPRRLVLSRNPWAPRGGSYLDEVSVETAPDLAEALRQFEAAEVDVGWLGRGLHRPRAGSILIDAGDVGWIVLHSGRSAGRWGAPGAAAQLASGIENSALERFGLGRVQHRSASQGYAGPPCELLARDDSSFLLELGRSLTALLSRPGHEITLSPAPPSVVQSRKRAGDYGFLLDVARCLGPSTREQQLSLLHEADPRLGQHAPAIDPNLDSDALIVATTATLSLAVVGRLRVVVATLPNLHGLASGRLGDTWLDPS